MQTKKHLARMEREQLQTRYIYTSLGIVLFLVVAFVIYGLVQDTLIKPSQPVATVNGEKISTRQFQERVRYSRQGLVSRWFQTYEFAQSFGSDPNTMQYFSSSLYQMYYQMEPVSFGQNVMDLMIEEALIRQEAKRRGITVSEAEVETAVQGFFQFFPNGTPTPAPTSAPVVYPTLSADLLALITPTPTLTPTVPVPTPVITVTATATIAVPTAVVSPTVTPTPYTVEGYKTSYNEWIDSLQEALKVSEDTYRQVMYNQLLREKVMEVINTDLAAEQEQVWARQIVVADEATAISITNRLNAGEDFGLLASQYSLDSNTAARGGDLGWLAKEKLPTVISDTAFTLAPRQISDPILADNSVYIVQVIDHQVRPLTAEEFAALKEQNFQAWLDSQRATAQVNISEGWMDIVPTTPAIPMELLNSLNPTGQ